MINDSFEFSCNSIKNSAIAVLTSLCCLSSRWRVRDKSTWLWGQQLGPGAGHRWHVSLQGSPLVHTNAGKHHRDRVESSLKLRCSLCGRDNKIYLNKTKTQVNNWLTQSSARAMRREYGTFELCSVGFFCIFEWKLTLSIFLGWLGPAEVARRSTTWRSLWERYWRRYWRHWAPRTVSS